MGPHLFQSAFSDSFSNLGLCCATFPDHGVWCGKNKKNKSLKDSIRKYLQQTCSPAELTSWFEPLKMEFDANSAELKVFFPHVHFEAWFVQKGKAAFETGTRAALEDGSNRDVRISYNTPEIQPSNAHFTMQKALPRRQSGEYTFTSFITNSKNSFPLAAAKEVCNPQSLHTYNPFILCGKSGTGKTHILRAISEALAEMHGHSGIFSGNADAFSRALEHQDPHTFARTHTAILVDDIQRIAHNGDLQEKLMLIMDGCQDLRRQMVFSTPEAPSSVEGLIEGLRSRMEVGLIVELKEPDIDVRMRFAQSRCRQHSIKLDREHMLMLAQRCSQLRHLSGIILKVAAFLSLARRDVTTADLENILRNSGEDKPVTAEDIINTVAAQSNIAVKDIIGGKRQPACVLARQTAMFLCRELLGMSYPAMGRIFGGKDHSTVIHSIQKIKKLMISDKETNHHVAELKKKCLSR